MIQPNKKASKRSSKTKLAEDNLWEIKFKKLVGFKKKFGHCYVPLRWLPDPELGRWVNNQRQFAKKGKLKKERAERLKKIGFSFNAFEDQWVEMFSALVKFKKSHGHCNVPAGLHKNPKLARWVHTNRNEMKKGNLTKDRFENLQKLGFVWRRQVAAWEEMYNKLVRFKNKFGHCRVPYDQGDSKFGIWVSSQRQLMKKGSLGKERVKKLNQIGFDWTIKKN